MSAFESWLEGLAKAARAASRMSVTFVAFSSEDRYCLVPAEMTRNPFSGIGSLRKSLSRNWRLLRPGPVTYTSSSPVIWYLQSFRLVRLSRDSKIASEFERRSETSRGRGV